MNSQKKQELHLTFEQSYKLCLALQSKLKDEYLLLSTEQDQKVTLQKKLTNALRNYYRNFIQLDVNLNKDITSNRMLFEDEGFGNCYIFIKQVLLGFAKNPDLMLAVIKKHNSWEKNQGMNGVIRVIISGMYENIVDDQLTHKDILYLMNGIIKMIIQSNQHPLKEDFTDNGLVYQILREFTKKSEYVSYSSQVVASTLLELAKLDRLIDFSFQDQQDLNILQKVSSKRFDSPTKSKQPITQVSSSFSDRVVYSKFEAYSEAFRKKDSKIRTTASVRTKNKHCVSSDLLTYLGIDENLTNPIFSSSNNNQNEIREQEQVNNQWALILNKKDSSNEKTRQGADITLLKNLVFIFYSDLFKMLYCMPLSMRTLCRLMYDELYSKCKKKKICLSYVANFVVGYWMLSALRVADGLSESSKISDFTNQNAQVVKQVVLGIIKNDFKSIDPAFHPQFSLILSNLRISLFNYLAQLVNIEVPNFQNTCQLTITQIKNYSVCLSVADVSILFKMIKQTQDQLNVLNDKMVKKVDRVYQMSQGTDIFSGRKDKQTNKQYKDYQSFILFSELVLPKQLSYDYNKYYNDAFKKNKIKNVLRQVLLNISDIEDYTQFPVYCNTLRELFTYILKTRQERHNLNSVDHIPVELKISYLLTITKNIKIEDILEEMLKEVGVRLEFMYDVWDKSKECYLKAISCIITQSEKISYNEINYKEELKKKKLEDFMTSAKINVCLTSAKTRQKQTILKTNMMKQISQQQKSRLWLQNQSKCIHSALNLQFIKSLTGEGENIKIKYDWHISNPNQFAIIFCTLPEVKEKGMSGEDNIGMKDILSHFLQFCIESIKNDPTYSILTQNLAWLEQNLQQRISKKIYDKLYPKMPTYDDLSLYFRLKTLDWVSYQHLKIDKFMQVDGMWDVAAKHLKKMDKMKTASQKLNCIVECTEFLMKSFSLVGAKEKPVTPDDIYPIIVNVVIKAAPRRLVSNINFIDMFGNQNRLMSEDGYFFTQLKSAVQYCQCMKHDNLGMQLIDFNRIIYEKEIQYGIYFLLARRKDSPRTVMRKISYLKEYCRKLKSEQDTQNSVNKKERRENEIIPLRQENLKSKIQNF